MPERIADIFVTGSRRGREIWGVTFWEDPETRKWEADDSGKLRIVEGVDAFIQAIEIMLRTEQGSRPLAPEAGTALNERIVQSSSRLLTVAFARAEVIRALMTDPRTESVSEVLVDLTDDALTIEARIIPVNNDRAISLSLALPRA